jgi:hypothetical protein
MWKDRSALYDFCEVHYLQVRISSTAWLYNFNGRVLCDSPLWDDPRLLCTARLGCDCSGEYEVLLWSFVSVHRCNVSTSGQSLEESKGLVKTCMRVTGKDAKIF